MKEIQTDILIIGSGIAALQCARMLAANFSIQIVTKASLRTSSSYRAQGGIAAVIHKEDQYQLHIDDTIHAGEHHHYIPNVNTLVKDGSECMKQLIRIGLRVDVNDDGTLALGLEGAHSKRRIVHAGGDATGKQVVEFMLQQLPSSVTIHEKEMATELLINNAGQCTGAITIKKNIQKKYLAKHTIIATGGAAALYNCSSNFAENTGDGIALAWRAGAEIADMEFLQFHPSLLFVDGEAKGLISEAVRGAGGKFVDVNRQSIMNGIHPLGDLAPRHITAHTLFLKRQYGMNTFIDISAIEHFEQKFPTIAQLCLNNGVQLKNGLIPVAPGSHFLMGGIIANDVGETTIPHLYAVGEVACTGVHGANRLASNSLLECIAFGKRLTQHILNSNVTHCTQHQYTTQPLSLPIKLLSKKKLKQLVTTKLGIVRVEEQIQEILKQLPSLQELKQLSLHNCSKEQIELVFMHITARLMAQAAFTRTESRGAHIRSDYPKMQSSWAQKWIVFQHQQMKVRNNLYEQHQARQHVKAIF